MSKRELSEEEKYVEEKSKLPQLKENELRNKFAFYLLVNSAMNFFQGFYIREIKTQHKAIDLEAKYASGGRDEKRKAEKKAEKYKRNLENKYKHMHEKTWDLIKIMGLNLSPEEQIVVQQKIDMTTKIMETAIKAENPGELLHIIEMYNSGDFKDVFEQIRIAREVSQKTKG